ncbi:MAG: ethanolamine utilization protein EutN [Verrucomicrobia bacterium]|nr:MAG: ethanolamine utilization protein EutN [Verrucomicrobiota bacterium]
MKLGHVIGKVTLNQREESYRGGRFLMIQPLGRQQMAGAPLLPLPKGNSLVVYDNLGAGLGDVIGYVEGAEATAPFTQPTPVDAFNAAIIDTITYQPPSQS